MKFKRAVLVVFCAVVFLCSTCTAVKCYFCETHLNRYTLDGDPTPLCSRFNETSKEFMRACDNSTMCANRIMTMTLSNGTKVETVARGCAQQLSTDMRLNIYTFKYEFVYKIHEIYAEGCVEQKQMFKNQPVEVRNCYCHGHLCNAEKETNVKTWTGPTNESHVVLIANVNPEEYERVPTTTPFTIGVAEPTLATTKKPKTKKPKISTTTATATATTTTKKPKTKKPKLCTTTTTTTTTTKKPTTPATKTTKRPSIKKPKIQATTTTTKKPTTTTVSNHVEVPRNPKLYPTHNPAATTPTVEDDYCELIVADEICQFDDLNLY